MITIDMRQPVILVGGADEEHALHGKAICAYLNHPIQYAAEPPTDGTRWAHFSTALAQMNAAHAPIAEDMCRGMDSMAGLF